jgi:hypothetical protein
LKSDSEVKLPFEGNSTKWILQYTRRDKGGK